MEKWFGAAGVCVNDKGQMLLVLQGKPNEEKAWTVPSGGKEGNETFEECCIREIKEETGYDVKVIDRLSIKNGTTYGIDVEVVYFEVEVIGSVSTIQEPDELIHEIAWKSYNEIKNIKLSFPEDREFLLSFINGKISPVQFRS